jgi:hypothetical protein
MSMQFNSKQWVPWNADDDARIASARIVGRARLMPVDGGLVHALLVELDDGTQRAVYLNRATGCFESCEVTS